ncbi:hypothetical protein ABIF91_002127 [Bradyrhizobium sp. USDA 241]
MMGYNFCINHSRFIQKIHEIPGKRNRTSAFLHVEVNWEAAYMPRPYTQPRAPASPLDHNKIKRPVHAVLVVLTKLIRGRMGYGDRMDAGPLRHSLTLAYDEEPLLRVRHQRALKALMLEWPDVAFTKLYRTAFGNRIAVFQIGYFQSGLEHLFLDLNVTASRVRGGNGVTNDLKGSPG